MGFLESFLESFKQTHYTSVYNEGVKYYNNGQYEIAIDKYSECVRNCYEHDLRKSAQIGIANSYFAIEEYKKALEEFDKVEGRGDNDLSYIAQKKGEVYFRMGDNKRAIIEFSKSIDYKRANAESYYFRAFAHKREKNYTESLKDIKSLIRINPEYIKHVEELQKEIQALMKK